MGDEDKLHPLRSCRRRHVKPAPTHRGRILRVVGMVLAVVLAMLLAPVLIAKLIADARGTR